MSSKITFFPVDNGDMTLIQICNPLRSTILIDCNIRVAADNKSDSTPDVAKALREQLNVDGDGRPYVDVMLLSHPDKDHCSGFERHFWVGPLSDYADDDKEQGEKRIIIRQIWSSPMVFRRANRKEPLCSDAKVFKAEARRRVRVNQENGCSALDGDRILILGEDQDGKTDSLGPILIKEGESFNGINGQSSDFLTSHLLAPMAPQDDEKEEELSRNDSSVIINFDMAASQENTTQRSRFLTGGDAGVSI
ncbi:ComEC/Rec2 family competence protein [Marinobacterium weihaiense]|uniref:Metallohydrolase n=1 Tax=Marinobacterium weihaiense TaxID=2851016 RepID=A0ABS6MEI8_9GAMM|nr:hypothetical protein [Marinobacterium weihaiense]MBV0934732.1 hypothetical protein [Marinobacterium weihaiense]